MSRDLVFEELVEFIGVDVMDVNRLLLEAAAESRSRVNQARAGSTATFRRSTSQQRSKQTYRQRTSTSDKRDRAVQVLDERCQAKPVIHRYRDGRPYSKPSPHRDAGRVVVDTRDWRREMAVIDLSDPSVTWQRVFRAIFRELKLIGYVENTKGTYRAVLMSFARWVGRPPAALTREHIREYLEYMVDGGQEMTTVALHLSALRTMLDKLCMADLTLGLSTPRTGNHLPVVLNKHEVQRLLESAVSMRDKLLLGLMYACGLRVSEVVKLRWRDVDIDRNVIMVYQGKGNVDRQVMLPKSYRELFARLKVERGDAYLFPSESPRTGRGGDESQRHLSTRTAQRVMKRTCRLAGITKVATPHSLRKACSCYDISLRLAI